MASERDMMIPEGQALPTATQALPSYRITADFPLLPVVQET
jgi:hypothetical protein